MRHKITPETISPKNVRKIEHVPPSYQTFLKRENEWIRKK